MGVQSGLGISTVYMAGTCQTGSGHTRGSGGAQKNLKQGAAAAGTLKPQEPLHFVPLLDP